MKDDETKKQAFLTDILSALENESSLVQSEGSKALFDIQAEIRGHMFQKLLTEFSKEQREGLILEWIQVKNERKAKEKFLHNMYTQFMEEDEYIQVEGIRALSEFGLNSDKQKALFAKFLHESTPETKVGFIAEWKKVRSSKSRRHVFLKNTIAQLEAVESGE